MNISNINNISCDSGYIFQTIIAPLFIKYGHYFTFVSPIGIEGLSHTCYRHIAFSFGENKFAVRFNFPWDDIKKIIIEEKPDIVWVNQPELASSFRSLLISIESSARLVTYLHYFPYEVNISEDKIIWDYSLNNKNIGLPIMLNFLSGIIASDIIILHSLYAKQILNRGMKEFSLRLSSKTKVFVIPPPVDISLIPQLSVPFDKKNIILYNHRLYTQYGTKQLISYLDKGIDLRKHDFVIMDILGNRNTERKKLDKSVDDFKKKLTTIPGIIVDENGNKRYYYRDILAHTKVGIAPFRSSCVWSMSIVDCLSAGIPVMAPSYAVFPELIPKNCLYDGSYKGFQKLLEKLIQDFDFWKNCSEESQNMTQNLQPDILVKKLLNAFN